MTRTKKALIATGAATLVTAILLTGVNVLEHHDTKDGKYRVELADYRVHTPSDQVYELFAILLPSGTPRKIGKPTSVAEDVVPGFVVSADSKRACFSQRNTALGTDRNLYCADIAGPGWQLVSQLMLNGGGVREGSIGLYDDGNRLFYTANPLGGLNERQYAVSVYGGEIREDVLLIDGFSNGNFSGWSGVVK